MAIYVPPTGETDQKKQNMSLQLIGGLVSGYEAAWTAYTPVITSGSGTITTKSATGRHKTIGKTVIVEINITITTNGTGAGSVVATLPSVAAAFRFILAGRENAVTGKMLQGFIDVSGSSVGVFVYDNSYPGGDGYNLIVTGAYEAA